MAPRFDAMAGVFVVLVGLGTPDGAPLEFADVEALLESEWSTLGVGSVPGGTG